MLISKQIFLNVFLCNKAFTIKSGVVNMYYRVSLVLLYACIAWTVPIIVFYSDFAQTNKQTALTKIFHQGDADVLEGKFWANFSNCFYKPCLQNNKLWGHLMGGRGSDIPFGNFITHVLYSCNLIRTFGLLYL